MAADELGRAISSRISWASSSFREVWTNPPDVFRKSVSDEGDEEEDLKWAALEKLPTYDRMRKGILKQVLDNGKVVHEEVDVSKLGLQDRKILIDSILKIVEEDNERFLHRLRDRTDRLGTKIEMLVFLSLMC